MQAMRSSIFTISGAITRFSVSFGDGGNPSPWGEEKTL